MTNSSPAGDLTEEEWERLCNGHALVTLGQIDGNREYAALLSYLPLKTYSAIPRFFLFSFQIQKQLRGAAGVVGYALRAKPMSRLFWTLSAWEDDRALREFVAKIPHEEAMKKLAPHMNRTAFTRWRVRGSEIPLRWDDAIRRSEQGAQN